MPAVLVVGPVTHDAVCRMSLCLARLCGGLGYERRPSLTLPAACLLARALCVASLLAAQEAAKAKGKQAAKSLAQQVSEEPIKLPMLLYNAVQVALCGWMCYEALAQAVARGFTVEPCNPFVETELGIARVLWVFYLSKILDFLDTVFIVARGQWGQFTFLHTYHHISIYLIYWLNANAGFDGDIFFTVVANSFVHAVMYGYYLLRILGVPFPFKNLVTQLQMVQFVAMNSQAVYILYNGCPFPNNITWFYLFYILSLLVLFANFYVHSYILGKGKGKKGGTKVVKGE